MEDNEYYLQMKDACGKNKYSSNNNNNSDFSNYVNNLNFNDLGVQQDYKMTIVVRKDLGMSVGKIASQVGHSVLIAYKNSLSNDNNYVDAWENISGQRKVVLECNSLNEIYKLREQAIKLNISFGLVTDAGKTEVDPGTITVIAFGPAPVSEIDKITGKLELLK